MTRLHRFLNTFGFGIFPLLCAVAFGITIFFMGRELLYPQLAGEPVTITAVQDEDTGSLVWAYTYDGTLRREAAGQRDGDYPGMTALGYYLPRTGSLWPRSNPPFWGLIFFLLPFTLVLGGWGLFFLLRGTKVKVSVHRPPRGLRSYSASASIEMKGAPNGTIVCLVGLLLLGICSFTLCTQLLPRLGVREISAEVTEVVRPGREYLVLPLDAGEGGEPIQVTDLGGIFTEDYLPGLRDNFYYSPAAGRAAVMLDTDSACVLLFVTGVIGVMLLFIGTYVLVRVPKDEEVAA